MVDISVIITCYNQEDYIGQAIESVMQQNTAATFKLYIHDDASTDSSQSIIKNYKAKYPSQVKLILQRENQMSKGLNTWLDTVFPYIDSTYVALLEGDDYWASPDKLEKQFDAMEQNRNIDLCFHECVSLSGTDFVNSTFSYPKTRKIIKTSQMIKNGGSYARTASLFFRSSAIGREFKSRFRHAPVGDRGLQIFLSLNKGALFVPGIKSIYRVGSQGSWTNEVYDVKTSAHRVEMTKFYSYVSHISKSNRQAAFVISSKENLKYAWSLLLKWRIYSCLLFLIAISKYYMKGD